jgi:hypothetical protein
MYFKLLISLLMLHGLLAFDIPMVFNVGNPGNSPLIDRQIRVEGPFSIPRNITLSFRWSSEEYKLDGVVFRGTEPRYDVSLISNFWGCL